MLNRRILPFCLLLGLAACASQAPVTHPSHGGVRAGTAPATARSSQASPMATTTAPAAAEPAMPLPPPPPAVAQPARLLADGSHIPAVQVLLQKAQSEAAAGDLDMAALHLERAQRLAPQSAIVYQRLADIRLRQQRAAEAEQLLRRALGLASTPAQQAAILRQLATAEQRQGNTAGAQEALNQAAALDLSHP